jgi:hypothetical protein
LNERRTLEPNPVTLQALHGLLEESFTGGGHAGNIILFPFYRRVDRLEDLFDRFCDFLTNPITRNKGHLNIMRSRDLRMEAVLTVYTPPYLVGSWKKAIWSITHAPGCVHTLFVTFGNPAASVEAALSDGWRDN